MEPEREKKGPNPQPMCCNHESPEDILQTALRQRPRHQSPVPTCPFALPAPPRPPVTAAPALASTFNNKVFKHGSVKNEEKS